MSNRQILTFDFVLAFIPTYTYPYIRKTRRLLCFLSFSHTPQLNFQNRLESDKCPPLPLVRPPSSLSWLWTSLPGSTALIFPWSALHKASLQLFQAKIKSFLFVIRRRHCLPILLLTMALVFISRLLSDTLLLSGSFLVAQAVWIPPCYSHRLDLFSSDEPRNSLLFPSLSLCSHTWQSYPSSLPPLFPTPVHSVLLPHFILLPTWEPNLYGLVFVCRLLQGVNSLRDELGRFL